MSNTSVFFDTNVLLYMLSEDTAKADRAEILLAKGGIISVQVLNEFTSVASRKLQMSYTEIRDFLQTISLVCKVKDLTTETHSLGLQLAERYRFSFYDSLILASAVLASCKILYSEGMQSGQKINEQLVIKNPFTSEQMPKHS